MTDNPSIQEPRQDTARPDAAPDKKPDDQKSEDKKPDGEKDSGQKDGAKKPVSPEKKRKIRMVLIAAGVLVLLVGIGWFAYYQIVGKYHEETDDAYLQADAVTIAPKVGGYVEEVLVRDNQDVAAGQPLVRIDPRDYRAQTEQFESQIASAHANADVVRAQIAEQESAIAEVRAQLAAAQSNAAFAANEVKRYAPLVEIGAENAEALSARRNQAAQGAQQVAAQRAALANAEKRVGTLRAQVRQAEAQAGSAEAQLKAASVNLQSTTLTASIAGRIGDQTVRVGQFVQPGTRLMTLVPMGSLYITANFKETQIGRMRVGQPAHIKVDALPGVELNGRVESVAPGTGAQFSLLPPQNATGNFTKIVQRIPVRVSVEATPETRQLLVPGLSVKVEVETKGAKDDTKRIKKQEENHQDDVKERVEDQQKAASEARR